MNYGVNWTMAVCATTNCNFARTQDILFIAFQNKPLLQFARNKSIQVITPVIMVITLFH